MSVLSLMILFFTTAFVHDSVQQSPDYLDEPLDWRNKSASHRDGQDDRLHRHGHAKRSVDDFSDDERHIYALTLDPDSKFKLSWTPDFQRQQVKFHVDISHSAPQSWFALGFSDRGDWPGADLCIGWEDWKGSLVVQVRSKGSNYLNQNPHRIVAFEGKALQVCCDCLIHVDVIPI